MPRLLEAKWSFRCAECGKKVEAPYDKFAYDGDRKVCEDCAEDL